MWSAQRTLRIAVLWLAGGVTLFPAHMGGAGATPPASAPAATGDDLELAALDDARDRMRSAIARQRVTAEFRVEELLSARGEPLERIDELLEECRRAGPLCTYRDGTCEVYLHLSQDKLAAALRRWLSDSDRPIQIEFAADQPILVSGCAAHSPRDPARAPVGWESLPVESRRLAEEAGRLDARLALLERLRRVLIEPGIALADLIADRPALGWDLAEADWKIAFSAARFTPDGRCFVRAELRMNEAARGLRLALQRSGREKANDAVSGDLLSRLNGTSTLTATGVGAPPADVLATSGPPEPAWAAASLKAVGEAKLGDSTADGKGSRDEAISRARADAIHRLMQTAQNLELSSGVKLESLIQADASLQTDVDEFLRGAIELRPAAVDADGRVRVTLAIPARRLWRLARPFVSAPDKGAEGRRLPAID